MRAFICIILCVYGGLTASAFSTSGCTDPAACNYDPEATQDNGLCAYSGGEFLFGIITDDFPEETSWTISDDSGAVWASGGGYTQPLSYSEETFCLPNGCYTFTINDAGGNGLTGYYDSPGEYYLVSPDGELLAMIVPDGDFGSQAVHSFCYHPDPGACTEVLIGFSMWNELAEEGEESALTIRNGVGTMVANLTLGNEGITTGYACLAPGCYSVEGTSTNPYSELAWELEGGGAELVGFAQTVATFSVGGEFCDMACGDPFACNYAEGATGNGLVCDYTSCYGCTYPNAQNYASDALYDNGSCEFPGCANPNALNYSALATLDDGTCVFPEGCAVDVTGDGYVNIFDLLEVLLAFGYECSVEAVSGCVNDAACNFDPYAVEDDGSCIFPDMTYDCDGNCLVDINGNGLCDEFELQGCTDPAALNYDPIADLDDGSCTYETATCAPVTFDGYTYEVTLIGTTCWFAENLRSTSYANGDAIPTNLSDPEWVATTSGAQTVYGAGTSPCNGYCDEVENLADYGRLYNWYAVADARGLCPPGWHVPTEAEWLSMESTLGMFNGNDDIGFRGIDEGFELKSSPSDVPPWNGGNTWGFSALPGGRRSDNLDGVYFGTASGGNWWTSTLDPGGQDAWFRHVTHSSDQVYRNAEPLTNGFSIRCVFDESVQPIIGCTDSTATNFEPLAIDSDGSCEYVEGCTNPSCSNFDAEAVLDDNSCDCALPPNNSVEHAIPLACGDTHVGSAMNATDLDGLLLDNPHYAAWFNPGVWYQAVSDSLVAMSAHLCTGYTSELATPLQDGQMHVFAYDEAEDAFQFVDMNNDHCGLAPRVEWPAMPGVTYYIHVGTFGLGLVDSTYTQFRIQLDCSPITYGCTEEIALNYDSAAHLDAGNCEFTIEAGCVVETASNYDPTATVNDGSCVFPTSSCAPVQFDGYTYDVVPIGDQCWFAENLRTEHYANGDAIPGDLTDSLWNATQVGAQARYGYHGTDCWDCHYAINSDTLTGRLYNFFAVEDARGLCPMGWHVPSDEDWMVLELHLGMPPIDVLQNGSSRGSTEGDALKVSSHEAPGWNGNSTSGFSAIISGSRHPYGHFMENIGAYPAPQSLWELSDAQAHFWSSTPYSFVAGYGGVRSLSTQHGRIHRNEAMAVRFGYSVRCLKGEAAPIQGCTNLNALNWNPAASVDDGSCTFPPLGCMDPEADNYDPDAEFDDGSCIYLGEF